MKQKTHLSFIIAFLMSFIAFFVFAAGSYAADTDNSACAFTTNDGTQCDPGPKDEPSCQALCNDPQKRDCHLENPCVVTKATPLENPLGKDKSNKDRDVYTIIGQAIVAAMGVVGALTLLVFVYGGFLWLTSAGNEEKVRHGSQAMLYAIIGLCIIFGSYALLSTIFKGLTG